MARPKRSRALLVLLGCVAALALCAAAALALLLRTPDAQDITIPGTRGGIPATVQLPAKLARTGEVPVVVLCHGFTGNRGGDGHFAPLADDLAAQGIATVRLDFAGCGDSAEPYTAYTLANMAADVDSAIAFMQSEYGATGPVGLVGHSMGGRLVALNLDETVAAAALYTGIDTFWYILSSAVVAIAVVAVSFAIYLLEYERATVDHIVSDGSVRGCLVDEESGARTRLDDGIPGTPGRSRESRSPDQKN